MKLIITISFTLLGIELYCNSLENIVRLVIKITRIITSNDESSVVVHHFYQNNQE